MPDMGDFSRARAPENPDLEDGDLCPYVCEACRDWRISNGRYDADRFVDPREKLFADGGTVEDDTDRDLSECPPVESLEEARSAHSDGDALVFSYDEPHQFRGETAVYYPKRTRFGEARFGHFSVQDGYLRRSRGRPWWVIENAIDSDDKQVFRVPYDDLETDLSYLAQTDYNTGESDENNCKSDTEADHGVDS